MRDNYKERDGLISDIFLENIEKFISDNDTLRLRDENFSVAGMNPFITHDSSPRGVMMSSHIAQAVVLDEAKPSIIQSGFEHELAKSVITKMVEKDIEIIDLVKRYETISSDVTCETLVIYREIETGIIDAISIPYFHKFHTYFGFKYEINDEVSKLGPGDTIPKDTILARPPTLSEDGDYSLGRDVNVAFMSIPAVDEDGFVVSKSFLEKFKFKIYETRTIDVLKDEMETLLNIYGDDEEFKPFPGLGERINETGVVFAKRKIDNRFIPVTLSKDTIKEFDPVLDNVVYARGEGGKVVDVKVYYNPKRKRLPSGTSDYLDKYAKALVTFYNKILSVYDYIKREYANVGGTPRIGHMFNLYLREAMGVVNSSHQGARVSKIFKREDLPLYKIEVTIEYEMVPTIGHKFTDFNGGKGVVVSIWDDEDMPVDEEGNRADMILDPKATIARINIGRLYETYIKAGSRKAKKIVTEIVGDPLTADDNKIVEGFKVILEFVEIVSQQQFEEYKKIYDSKNIEAMRAIVEEVVKDELYVFIKPSQEAKYLIINNIKKSKFAPVRKPVKFRYKGREVKTKDPVLISPLYTMLLFKIADSPLTTASAKVNNFGIPVVISRKDKYSLPYRNSPVRNISETEGRLFAAYVGEEFTAELVDRATSLDTHRELYTNILASEKPTDIEEIIDRNVIPYGDSIPIKIFRSILNTVGMDMEFVDDSNRYYDYVEYEEEKIVDMLEDYDFEDEVDEIDEDENLDITDMNE